MEELLEGYNEDQIKAIAESAQNKVTKDITLLLRGEYDFEAFVDTYEYWLKVGGLSYRHVINPETRIDILSYCSI